MSNGERHSPSSGYAAPILSVPSPLTSADIARLFPGKPEGWFGRDRVRKRLYARGFPHPFERGLWSAEAVKTWLAAAGSNPGHVPPTGGRRRRVAPLKRANGYAPVAETH